MKITKSAQNDEYKLRRRTSNTTILSGVRIIFFVLICLSATAVVLFSCAQAGWYIHQRYTSWKRLTISEMREHFECDEAFASTRPWWTSDQWREVRDIYRAFAKENKGGTYQMSEDVFDFSQIAEPFQAGEEKGRGLKAARDIRQGEIVLRSTNNTVVFNDGLAYRKFLFALEERFPTFACDIMMWNWTQDLDDEGDFFGIVVDLNDNNLLNEPEKRGEANVRFRCGAPPVTGLVSWLMWPRSLFHGEEDDSCMENLTFYASRDIRKGEELLSEYSDFVSTHSWSEMGL